MTRRQAGALLLLFVTACAEKTRYVPREPAPAVARAGHGYDLDVVARGAVVTRPVPVSREALQQTLRRRARELHLTAPPPEEARRMLEAALEGEWLAEVHQGRVFTLVPADEKTSVTPLEDESLRREYLRWCDARGGGDCLSLFTDGPFLRVDDRRTLALALALDSILGEAREALARELLDPRTVLATLAWMGAIYLALWMVPEPTSKALAAALTVVLLGWLGLDTLHGLWAGWAQLAHQAHRARSFQELRAAGEQYAKVMGKESARVLVMGLITVMGSTAAQVAKEVRALAGYAPAAAQATAQGVPLAAIGEVEEIAAASDGSLVVMMAGEGGAPAAGELAASGSEAAGLTEEAFATKLAEAEATTLGPRLPPDVPLLERLQPSLEHPPAGVAQGDALWRRYVAYFGQRLGALKDAALKGAREAAASAKRVLLPPRTWRSYLKLFQDIRRGVAYQRSRVASLRAEAALPRPQRTRLQSFEQPRVEQNVGMDTGAGVRYADAVVIEQSVAPGQLPRVETFSLKSRDFTEATLEQLRAQVARDAEAAVQSYGGTADIRRPSLNLRGVLVPISKVHLIYDAGLRPPPKVLKTFPALAQEFAELGVEVRFE